jgi:7-carboxy-7-deazaguanine synthase
MMTLDTILEEIEVGGLNHVVLTGGEPMLFDAIEPLAHALKERGKTITVETAGTIFRDLECDLMSISPKLAHSAPGTDTGWEERHNAARWQPKVVQKLIDQYDYQLKFVVADLKDFEEIDTMLSALDPVPPDRILIMPEGRSADELWRSARLLVPEVMKRNFRLAPRLQIDIFGDKRGT